MKRRAWAPTWDVSLEWVGNKVQVLPLLEHIVGRVSDSSGTWMAGPNAGLIDAQWYCKSLEAAEQIYKALRKVVPLLRSYVRLKLLHDYDPLKRFKLIQSYRRGRFKRIAQRQRVRNGHR